VVAVAVRKLQLARERSRRARCVAGDQRREPFVAVRQAQDDRIAGRLGGFERFRGQPLGGRDVAVEERGVGKARLELREPATAARAAIRGRGLLPSARASPSVGAIIALM